MTSSQTHKPMILLAALLLAVSMTTAMLAVLSGKKTVQAAPIGGTNISGPIVTNTTWTLAGSPYILTDDLTINPGITLTIEPGVTVLDGEPSLYEPDFVIEGHLQAAGTVQQPITFTSLSPGPAEWNGLVFYQGSGYLEYVTIQHADGAVCTESYLSGYQVVIKNSILENNNVGICSSYSPVDSQIILENVTIRNNESYAITVHPSSLPYLQMNNVIIEGNAYDRLAIELYDNLTQNITLSSYQGLEAYEIIEGTEDGFIVPTGITLTVDPGVTVMVNEGIDFGVTGHLQAVGTVTKPITFTSALNSGANEWYGLFFDGGNSHLAHTTIRYADIGVCAFEWSLPTGPVILIQNSVIYSNVTGICLVQGGQAFIEDSTIRNNVDYAIVASVDGVSGLNLANVSFQDNGYDRVFIETYGTNESLTDNTTFTPQPGLEGYELSNLMIVPTTVTLTLDPSAVMLMDEGAEINVLGHLQAIGTPNSPITFTTPDLQPHNLTELQLVGGDSHISNAIFQYIDQVGIGYLEPGVEIVIENSVFQNMPQEPLGITAVNLHQAQLTNLAFINNASNRIMIWGEGVGTIVDDVVLKAHEGLEGYVYIENFPSGAESLIVSDSVTLTVESDVSLFFPENRSIQVNGRLRTLGTVTQPITITSAANTGPGEWDGIIFEGGEGDLQYTTVRYGENNVAVVSDTAVVTLTHTQIVSGITGLAVEEGAVTAVCSTFSQNQNDGIHIFNGNNPNVTVFSSSINDNGGAGLNNQNSLLVDARYNWWGDASGPGGIGSGSGDEISGTVNYEPWLTEPPSICFTSVPTAVFQTDHLTVTEGMATAVFTVTLDTPPVITATVHVSTTANTALPFQDYVPMSSTLTFPPGQTVQTVTVTILDDGQVEMTESLTVTLSAVANVELGVPATAVLTITDDDEEPVVPVSTFTTEALTVTEGAATAVLTITLNSAPEITATVHVSTTANTAQPFQDYEPLSTTLTFPPGQTVQSVTVTILDDAQVEITESLTVTLSAVANVELGVPATAVLTITDDDAKPVIPVLSFAADTITVTEGMATAVLTFTLNIAPEITVTVDYETVADTAVPHSDYLPISGTLTFAPGSTIQVVSIPLLDDDLVESNEIFNLVLLSPMNLILAGDTVTIVIQDDDMEVTETAVIYLPFITLP